VKIRTSIECRGGQARRGRAGRVAVLALLALAAAGGSGWWAGGEGGASVAAVVPPPTNDMDGDGLVDELESVLGTWSCHADTDGDSFSDLEEVARKSNPLDSSSLPLTSEPSLAMVGFQVGRRVHVATLVFVPDGNLHAKRLRFGVRVGDQMLAVSLSAMRGGAPIQVRSGRELGSKIVVVDPVIQAQAVLARRGMSVFATLAQQGTYLDAEACDFAALQGSLFQLIRTSGSGTTMPTQGGTGIGLGHAYRPIDPSSQSPSSVMGEVCAQTTTVVRVVGAVVTQEVIAADCVPGWDTYCSPGCVNTVGNTVRSVDPAALIGG